jgi:hypothetical protein
MDYIDTDEDTKKYFRNKLWWDLINTLGKEVDEEDLNDLRHGNQPTMFDLYIKNIGGDYRGRRGMVNTKMNRRLGLDKFKKAIDKLEKRVEDTDSPEAFDIKETFGFADFPERKKRIMKRLIELIGKIGKPAHMGSTIPQVGPGRPYDHPISNRLARGSTSPTPKGGEEMDWKEQKLKNTIGHVPEEDAEEHMQKIEDEMSEAFDQYLEFHIDRKMDIVHEVHGKDYPDTKEGYQAFFRAMMKKHGITSIGDLSDEKKKEFFNKVDKHWKKEND